MKRHMRPVLQLAPLEGELNALQNTLMKRVSSALPSH